MKRAISLKQLTFQWYHICFYIYLFSLDCLKWGLLQLPNEDIKRKCLLIKGRFIGDPSHEYEYIEKKTGADEMDQDDDENSNMVNKDLFPMLPFRP